MGPGFRAFPGPLPGSRSDGAGVGLAPVEAVGREPSGRRGVVVPFRGFPARALRLRAVAGRRRPDVLRLRRAAAQAGASARAAAWRPPRPDRRWPTAACTALRGGLAGSGRRRSARSFQAEWRRRSTTHRTRATTRPSASCRQPSSSPEYQMPRWWISTGCGGPANARDPPSSATCRTLGGAGPPGGDDARAWDSCDGAVTRTPPGPVLRPCNLVLPTRGGAAR